jgi:nucleoside-diphosphate kinase
MANERTLIIIKPDGVQRGLVGEILGRLERRGLQLVALKFMRIDRPLAERHYAMHHGKPFYEGLVSFITSGPVVAGVVAGPSAIEVVRSTMGGTNPAASGPGTIRGDFAVSIGRNLIHGSDGPESAAREIDLFFRADELVDWQRDTERWIADE